MVRSMNSAGMPVASAHHRPVLREVGDGTKALASFSAALNNPDFSDVTFIVSGERNNGETTKVHAHRSLLAIRSSVFREMFFGGFPESNQKEIEVQQFSHEHFLAVLEWAYGGRTAMTARDVLGVLQAAAFYGFDDLVAECRALAERFIDEDNVLYLLEHAHAMQEDELVALALRYVARNAAHVLPQASWLHLGADCVEKVLRLEAIDCDEAVLLERTVRWLEDNTTLLREVDRATVDPFSLDKAKKEKEIEVTAATETRPGAEPLVDRLFPLLRVSHVPAPMLVDRVRPLCPLYGAVRTRYVAALEQKLLPAHMYGLDAVNWMPPRAPTVISTIQVDVSPTTLLRDWTIAYTGVPGDNHLSPTFFDAIPAHAVFVAAGEMIPGRTDAIAIVAVGFARHARTVARSQAPLVVEDGDICWMGSTTSFGFSPRPDGRAQHALHAAAATLTARIANGLRWNVGGAPTTPLGPAAPPSQPAGSRFIYWK